MAVDPNNLARLYAGDLNKAQSLLDEGGPENLVLAKSICLRLRLSPYLGIYARARMNLVLAKIYQVQRSNDTHNILLHGYEVLDLLDIYRQKRGDEISEKDLHIIGSMEEQAKDIIDTAAKTDLDKEALRKKVQSGALVEKDIEPGAPKRVWINPSTPEQRAQIAENRRKNPPFEFEGYLRKVGEYKDIVKYVPFSRQPTMPSADSAEDADISDQPNFVPTK